MIATWARRFAPVLFGVALVLMLHGDALLALLAAIAFFAVYVGASWNAPPPRRYARRRARRLPPRRDPADEEPS